MKINNDLMLPALYGFEDVKRFWDKHQGCYAAKILPGEYYVTLNNECITTVLGSCVSACVRDVKLGIGGMNHFMLPGRRSDYDDSIISEAARYGNYAMEHLINTILSNGGSRDSLEFKIFGGAKILKEMLGIGQKNIDFITEYMETEGFNISVSDLGDVFPRKIVYFPKTGRVLMKRLQSVHNKTVIERENKYKDILEKGPLQGDIELF